MADAWPDRGTNPEKTPEPQPVADRSESQTALGVRDGLGLPSIGVVGSPKARLGSAKSKEVQDALDDVARGLGLPASGAGQQDSTPKRSKDASGLADVRQGFGLAASSSLPSLAKPETSPKKGKVSNTNSAADLRGSVRRPSNAGVSSLGLGAAAAAGRVRRNSLAAPSSGSKAAAPDMPLSARSSTSNPQDQSPLAAGFERQVSGHPRKSAVAVAGHVATAATKGVSSRRSSLAGGTLAPSPPSNERHRSVGGRRPSVAGAAPQAKKKAPKSYQEDDEAVLLAKEVFEFFDGDGSGLLDIQELEIAQHILQDSPLEGAGVAAGIWADCNPDVDGNGEVDMEEWASFMESIYQILGRKQFISVITTWLTAANPEGADAEGRDETSVDLQRAAALRIQAIRRGSRVRDQLALKKVDDKKRSKNRLEHQLTTAGELWDLLTRVDGTYGRTITVADFVDVFQRAKETGMNDELALMAPVTDEDNMAGGTKVDDVLPEQVGRLCELVLDGEADTMTDGEVWFELACTKSDRLEVGRKNELLRRDLREKEINHKAFDKILPILARALSLDKQIILSHIAWLKTKVFEAPASLLALVVQQCANNSKGSRRLTKEEAYRGSPDVSILDIKFTLNDQVKLCINGHLVEEKDAGHPGINPNELQQLFSTMSRHLHEKEAARMELRKEAHPHTEFHMCKVPTAKKPGKDEQDTSGGFEGAEAFQVLLEELFKLCPAGKFVSPLAMIVHMIRMGTENPLVSEMTIAANAEQAIRKALSEGKAAGPAVTAALKEAVAAKNRLGSGHAHAEPKSPLIASA